MFKKLTQKVLSLAIAAVLVFAIGLPSTALAADETLEFDATVTGNIAEAYDSDEYSVILTESGKLSVKIMSRLSISVELLDSNYQPLIGDRVVNGTNSKPSLYEQELDLEAGAYHIRVTSSSAYIYAVPTGTYDITASFAAADNNELNVNDTPEQAHLLIDRQPVTGLISQQDGIDYYRYELGRPMRLSVKIMSRLSISIELLDSDFQPLDESQIVNGSDSKPEVYEKAYDLETGTYYVRIETSSAYIYAIPTGTYDITVQASALNLNTASAWAHEGITTAVMKGFVPFDLQNNYTSVITRQEFCRMAIRWLEYATGKNIDTLLSEKGLARDIAAFSDTQDPDTLAAYALGITGGTIAPTATTPGQFNPNGEFSREQAATMLRNICRAYGADISDCPDARYSDIGTVSSWAVDSINYCIKNGLMTGTSTTPPTFSPKMAFSREQSIITFNNIAPDSLPRND